MVKFRFFFHKATKSNCRDNFWPVIVYSIYHSITVLSFKALSFKTWPVNISLLFSIIVPRSTGCTTYTLTSHQICLMYFPVPARYSTAKTLCQAGGGNLFKIDSQEKFDLFEDYHGMLSLGICAVNWYVLNKFRMTTSRKKS